tara:strand:+ start:729 stop:1811 length:1083 start_codon:yes stop_codon:yes gene_type:complete
MKIRDRYIAKTLLTYTFVVLLIWLSIYSFFNFLSELENIGTQDYTILQAFKYILFQMPQVAYDQASAVILLGCVLGMGHLATTGQLIVFRIAGISILKITWISLKIALIFVIILISIGETIAPLLNKYSANIKANALGQDIFSSSQKGFWIRDGDNFINVENNLDGHSFFGVTIIEVNKFSKIERVIKSENALFDGNSLELNAADIFSIEDKSFFENISFKNRNSYDKTVSFDQNLVNNLEKSPDELSTWVLFKQIEFLSDNKLRSGVFEVELYKRLVRPLSLIAMILMAMLFIFGSTRDATLGRKIFFGVALGLIFELISRIGGAIALSYDFSPFFSSILPAVIVMGVSLTLLIRKSLS